MTNTGREIIWNAQRGVVTGEEAGRRGAVKLLVTLADGRQIKTDARHVEFADTPRFAAPTGRVEFSRRDRDYYGDRARMSARW